MSLKEAVEIAMSSLYEKTITPELSRKTMKMLLNLFVSNVHLNLNGL